MVLSLAAGAAVTSSSLAQTSPAATKAADNASILSDFIHYTRIQNYDLAEAMGAELIGKKLTNAEFVSLVEASGDIARFEETSQRAMRVTQLEKIAAAMTKSYETGKLERARNPEQVAKNITLLTGSDRGRRLAEERLVFAGEYAMPQLLEAFLDRSNPTRQAAVQRVIVSLGRLAVIPMCTALTKVSPVQQEQIADVIGLIPHASSLPFLRDVAETTQSDAVKKACVGAMARIGADGAGSDRAALFNQLAEAYYAQRSDVTSFPGEDNQLVWSYEPSASPPLVMSAIRTPVYHEAMTMRFAERALQLESVSGGPTASTLSLWVAANFRREIETPAGYENPAYPTKGDAARRSADYYAAASGAEVAQRVLARAIASRDTQLARKAIAAVEHTAGGKDLWSSGGSDAAATPLLAALTYPNRRVQYEAALALAAAQPTTAFPGSDRVVPTLASTIRNATTMYAIVIANEPELYQSVRSTLNKMGYTVLPQARTLADLAAPLSEAPAVDLVVTAGIRGENIATALTDVRGQSKTLATPALVLTDESSYTDLRRRFASDSLVAIRQSGIGEAAITETVKQLVESSSGGAISEAEAASYSSRSLGSLRDLAVSGNTVLNAGDAATALIGALPNVKGAARLQVAEILSRINQDRAQRAIMAAALASTDADRIALLGLVSDSGKRFGNFLEAGQISRLTELATKGADAEATAAASLIGTMKLAKTELVPMILNKK
jgi:hypothetical protein